MYQTQCLGKIDQHLQSLCEDHAVQLGPGISPILTANKVRLVSAFSTKGSHGPSLTGDLTQLWHAVSLTLHHLLSAYF